MELKSATVDSHKLMDGDQHRETDLDVGEGGAIYAEGYGPPHGNQELVHNLILHTTNCFCDTARQT